ncbi:MAG: hypothetical protein ACREJD_10310 [Phycisphaerales bacterium]
MNLGAGNSITAFSSMLTNNGCSASYLAQVNTANGPRQAIITRDRPVSMMPLAIPADCIDGMLGAHWRSPELYLQTERRSAISSFARIDAEPGLAKLRADLASGKWAERNRTILALDALDIGYRLVICEITRANPGNLCAALREVAVDQF